MSKKEFQNHELDRIGSDLLAAARIREDEIEKIIAAPNLFEGIKTGIKQEQARRSQRAFPVWNWQIAGAFAILTLAVIGTATAFIFRAPDLPQQASTTNVPETKSTETRQEIPPQISALEKTITEPASYRQAAITAERSKPQNRIRKPTREKQPQIQTEEGEFYALTIGGNWEADAENLRIVRTELSRAELFALGLNLPVENETQKIKTDLLVGANGVPKAIRFVE